MDLKKENEHKHEHSHEEHHDHHDHSHDEHQEHDHHEHKHDEHCSCGHDHEEKDYRMRGHDHHGHGHHKHEHDEHCSCGHKEEKDYRMRGHDHHEHDLDHHKHDHHEHKHHDHCTCGHDHHEHDHSGHDHHGHSHDDHHEHCACGHDHSGCGCEHHHGSLKEMVVQFGISALFFVGGIFTRIFFDEAGIQIKNFYAAFSTVLFVIAWLIAGYKVLLTSVKNILKGQVFDENFLMSVATIGAFILGDWTEAASVMLFYNLGEIAQGAIVEKARKSIINVAELNSSFARVLINKKTTSTDEKDYEIK